MDGFTIVDAVVAAIILISAVLAYSRGIVREVMAIVGWVVAAIAAYIFAPLVQPLVTEIPYVGTFLQGSCELSMIAAFAAVFAGALVVVSLFTPLFSSVVQRSALNTLDQGLGFFFGALRGIVLVAVALLVYDRVVVTETVVAVENSRSAQVFANVEEDVDGFLPDTAPVWILDRYEGLVGVCGGDPLGSDGAPV